MKKTISIFIVMAMLFGTLTGMRVLSNAGTNGHSQADAVNWANSQVGQALDYDGAYGAQCVDLIYYYYNYLGQSALGGDASAYVGNELPSGWQRINYYSGISFQPGDIAVWNPSGTGNGGLGHIGIIVSADNVGFNCVEQNWDWVQSVTTNWHNNAVLSCVIRPDFSGSSGSGQDPQGVVDIIRGEVGGLYFTGWAFDKDVPAQSIPIHVYVGGPAGAEGAQGFSLPTNVLRDDVNTTYGLTGIHGYSHHIHCSLSGKQTVYFYAVNYGAGSNKLFATKTVDIPKDTENPVISDIETYDYTNTGYKLSFKVTDNVAVKNVRCATWTSEGGQDDITWHDVGSKDGENYVYEIKTADHNNELGNYVTHIYASDCAENVIFVQVGDVNLEKLSHKHTPVSIPEVKPTCTESGLSEGMKCSVCGEILKEQEVLPALGHKPVTVIENKIDATCRQVGYYDEVVYCSVCEAELSRENKQIEIQPHRYTAVVTQATCTANGYTKYICEDCSYSYIGDYTPIKEHNFQSFITEPTTESRGYTVHACRDCGYTFIDSITDILPSQMHYIIPAFNALNTTLTVKSDENEYFVSAYNGVFVLENIKADSYRVYATQENALTICVGEYDTKCGAVTNDNDIYIPLGNVNGDGVIDIADVSLLLAADFYGKDNTGLDITGDNMVTIEDVALTLQAQNFGKQSAKIV